MLYVGSKNSISLFTSNIIYHQYISCKHNRNTHFKLDWSDVRAESSIIRGKTMNKCMNS